MSNETGRVTRKLRAILSADVKGYSLLMADDEVFTIRTLKEYRVIMSDLIQQHSGRVVDNPGDNLLAEFSSAVDAVEAAVQIQNHLKKENAKFVEDKRLQFRIGVNIGDVVQDGDRIYGEGVNIAARIESLADPGGICISLNTYDQVKGKLDVGFEYLGEHEVKNIKEPVRVYRALIDTKVLKPLVEEELKLPDKPSIAVLPFDNMSGDPSQEYFSDGLTEQIINGLCKVPDLFVIARNSSFAYEGLKYSIKQTAKELGVRYILEGSVQKAGNRVRITAQLIDAKTDYHMWSENYDRNLADIFALQDEITIKLIRAMQIELTTGKQAQLWGARTDHLQAYDKWLRGSKYLYKFKKNDIEQARHFFMDAVALDRKYDLAHASVGMTHVVDLLYGWSKSPLVSFEQAEMCAGKAFDISETLDITQILIGWINFIKRQHSEAKKRGARAIALNPNGAEAHIHHAYVLSFMRETNTAIRLIKRAFRLNPIPPIHYYYCLGIAYGNDGQHSKAIDVCKQGIDIDPNVLGLYPPLVFSSVLMGQLDDARKYAKQYLKFAPKFSLSFFKNILFFEDQSDTDRHIEALRLAGLPD